MADLAEPRRIPVERDEDVAACLESLVGIWEGTGRGGFPTIDDFTYREVLHLTAHEEDPILRYEQRTWRHADGTEVPSHWESGFIRAGEDGVVDLLNAQESGRVEVLQGRIFELEGEPGRWELVLSSVLVGYDDRVASSSRTVRFGRGRLSYEMSMSTDRVPEAQTHLTCRLKLRQS